MSVYINQGTILWSFHYLN